MNSLVIILIAMAVLVAGYVFYGRWLAKKWGIDEKAKTPAFTHEDGEDFGALYASVKNEGKSMGMMLAVTFTALIQKTVALVKNVAAGQATFLVGGLQLIVAVLLMVLGVMVAYSCIRRPFGAGKIQTKRQRNTAEK